NLNASVMGRDYIPEERRGRCQASDGPSNRAPTQVLRRKLASGSTCGDVSTHPGHVVALQSFVERVAQPLPCLGILVQLVPEQLLAPADDVAVGQLREAR